MTNNIITYPNQKIIKINREVAKSDFLGIKNENWMTASRDLGAHALRLYLYLASNADGFNLALSQRAAEKAIGIPRSTYYDQFRILENKGYLKHIRGNTYEFFEKPVPRDRTSPKEPPQMIDFTADGQSVPTDKKAILAEDIEINNITDNTNNHINNYEKNQVVKPDDVVITIRRPEAKGTNRPEPDREKTSFLQF